MYELPLELIEQHLEVDRPIVNGMAAVILILRDGSNRQQREQQRREDECLTARRPDGLTACHFSTRTSRNIPASMWNSKWQ